MAPVVREELNDPQVLLTRNGITEIIFWMDSDQTTKNLTKPSETHLRNEPIYLSQ
jgi:hypothetical protein